MKKHHARRLRFACKNHSSLDRNAAHKFAANHALSIYGPRIVYSYIPKNGCSNLRYSIALANGCISGPKDAGWIHKNNMTFKATLGELVTANYTFVVLRCPYARLASVFLDKVVQKYLSLGALRNIPLYSKSRAMVYVSKIIRRLREGGKPNFGHLSFRDFVTLLCQPDALMINHHWAPQSSFLVYEEYDDVFRLEEISAAVKETKAKTGFEIIDARNIIRHGTDQLDKVDDVQFADISISEIAAMKKAGKTPLHASLYDTNLVDIVRTLYADDIALYGQHFGVESLLF